MTPDKYKKKCDWLAKFYAEAASTGRVMQSHFEEWVDYDRGPNMQSHPDEWRIKPEPVKSWVVWVGSTIVGVWESDELAQKQAINYSNAVIQEITRPESQ